VEQTQYGETLVQMGINNHDFKYVLQAGETFTAPAILAGYTNEGFETMSHSLNRFANETILREGLRPILYNSWEATEFEVSCEEQIKLAKKANEMGAELFVVDDGWFGERHGIDNGLGDWYVNDKKFPNGLNPLIEEVKNMDMLFGIWIEPEMVNPLAQLYKDHPEWIYQFETRVSDTSRGQYVLNVTKPEVKQFIYDMIDDLLSSYDIDYIKWDANRPMSQTDVKQDIWVKHIEAVYDIVKELKKKHPNVLFEACASGGGRVDYGILGTFDDFWTSDNTDAYDRLKIQHSYSFIYPIKAMRAWVTDVPNFLSRRDIPLTFRFHSAMMGTLGIGCNILKFTEEEMALSAALIEEYKAIRHIVQEGDFYRLENTSKNAYHLFGYVREDEALLFAFLPQTQLGHCGTRVRLRGLNEQAQYAFTLGEKEIVKSGSYLMNHGIDLRLVGDYDSQIIKFNQVK
ncbi:MAG TPA: alpha-galactosidase, partial [Firmicutes bacterium]|nr:alpha-galactosidase [Bacillota bacterium]